ncbi:recombinase family protein [uncultured Enterovirga sp.]|uniref:recombinase family protein n=1 Tax=uncultured Enterovirga sp. TaxID=2026352 RepID=UPI0035C97461
MKSARRCAVYTRVSTEHGLEQEFNSLDNQREAAEAYIKSQAHEGWRLLRDRYDDGGFSGGSTDRPALLRLLDQVRMRRVDVIVVYKVDRLTRSLADFAKLVELFDADGVSFVSVTQAFNTTTSMGRLTLNVLLSFAQFEREVTGERIRDKIAASKRRGMWVGGNVPLGYRVEAKKLLVIEEEAEQVRLIFRRYLELGSIGTLLPDLRGRNTVTKRLVRSGVVVRGGIPFTRGSLAYLLRNRFYVGEIAFRGEVHAAEHPAILDRGLFDAVQRKLTDQRNGDPVTGGRSGALLAGKLFDERGHRMTPTHCRKAGARYRYYISRPLLDGHGIDAGRVRRVPAPEVERQVLDAVRARCPSDEPDHDLIRSAVDRIEIAPDLIRVTLMTSEDEEPRSLEILWQRASSRRHREVIASPGRDGPARPMRIETRSTLLGAIARGRRWLAEILSGQVTDPDAIAHREGCSRRQVNATISLAHLAPDIIEAAIAGHLPHGLALRDLTDPPLAWSEQRSRIGIAA